MSLSSVLQTALSGMGAAEAAIGVIANNLANSRTTGFKASAAALQRSPRRRSVWVSLRPAVAAAPTRCKSARACKP